MDKYNTIQSFGCSSEVHYTYRYVMKVK